MTPSAVSVMPATAPSAGLPHSSIPTSAITTSTSSIMIAVEIAHAHVCHLYQGRVRLVRVLMSIVSRKHSSPASSATVDPHASPRSAGTSAPVPPLSAVIAPKLEATTLHPTIPSGSMNAQQSQEPPLLRTETKRSIYPNRSTLGLSGVSDRLEMAPAMTPGITIPPQGSISTKSRRKGLKRSKEGLATATTEKLDMTAVKPPMLPQENAISQPSEEPARAHIRVQTA